MSRVKIAIASTDFLAADAVGAYLMGFDLSEIGYLYHCQQAGLGQGDIEKIESLGKNWRIIVASSKDAPPGGKCLTGKSRQIEPENCIRNCDIGQTSR